MKIGPDHATLNRPLRAILGVVALTLGDRHQRDGLRAQEGAAGVVLETGHPETNVVERALARDPSDDPLRSGDRLDVEHAHSFDGIASWIDVAVAEQLVSTADREHDGPFPEGGVEFAAT